MSSAFQSSADIGNRCLQHCGQPRMDPILGFKDGSPRANEVAFVYDKRREYELQRNTWKYAIKKTTLRPLDSNSMLLAPSLWSTTVTYYNGSVVSDQIGNLWISISNSNLNNDPTQTNFWEPYYGPMAVPLYDTSGTTAYNAGEIVYSTIGNGLYRVFLSLISNNGDDPLVQTIWNSASTYAINQTVTLYAAWNSGTTYGFGAGVTRNSVTYVSVAAGNLNHDPATDNGTRWQALILTKSNQVQALEWLSTTTYTLNQIVDYSNVLYIAAATSTGAIPSSSPASWTALTGGTAYQSFINLNIGNEPDLAPLAWAIGTTYAAGNQVYGTDLQIYTSVGSGNIGNNPVTDGGVHWTATGIPAPWTTSFVGGTGSANWLEIGGSEFPSGVSLTAMNLIYPEGSGPLTDTFTRNVFRLPAGYLRKANQNPKETTTWGGAPSGIMYDDFVIENFFLTSWSAFPINLRFVANVTDVRRMDTMFCEGLAAGVALEVVETLTQSTGRLKTIADVYKMWMGEARTVNAIEEGWEDPPDDDFITCRY